MKIRLAILIGLMAVLLSGCSYWLVEEAPVQIGSPVMQESISNR